MQTTSNPHGLNHQIIYGPVVSRRFGVTLGVNILPLDHKLCSFHCVYCQLGGGQAHQKIDTACFPTLSELRQEWRNIFDQAQWQKVIRQISCVVVSGNGEPTLHPQFAEMMHGLLKLRDEDFKSAKLICFTNGWRLNDRQVFSALAKLDECHLKWDANLGQVDVPEKNHDALKVIACAKKLPNLVLQSCFVDGVVNNTDDQFLSEWSKVIFEISPKRVDLYTVSRPTTVSGILPVRRERLLEIADHLRRHGQDATLSD